MHFNFIDWKDSYNGKRVKNSLTYIQRQLSIIYLQYNLD